MNYASQDSIRLVVIGLVSIAAISMGAATIESTVELGGSSTAGDRVLPTGGGEGGLDINDTGGNDSSAAELDGGDSSGLVANLSRCVEPLAAWYGGILYFGSFLGIVYLMKRAYSLGAAFLGMYAIAPVFFTAYFLLTQCASTLEQRNQNNLVSEAGDIAGQGVVPTDVSPMLVAAVFGVALVAVAAVLLRASGDQTVTTLDEDEEGGGEQPDVADLAAAAGKAADRLEQHNADVDNEVYRAWWEMTSLLNVPNPDSSTPREFARAAIDVGMDESDVDQLTTLFEEVRYGRRDPESREERALEVLRHIESHYGADADGEGHDGR
ncbi:MAG: DUF4129 domain-containing protein [Haloarculaceae archaeon]